MIRFQGERERYCNNATPDPENVKRKYRKALALRSDANSHCSNAASSDFLHNRKGSRWSSYLDSDCLFPRELGATGMNSSVLTASLTGRIQFFYYGAFRCCVLLTAFTGLR
jgi:hypothetical protein